MYAQQSANVRVDACPIPILHDCKSTLRNKCFLIWAVTASCYVITTKFDLRKFIPHSCVQSLWSATLCLSVENTTILTLIPCLSSANLAWISRPCVLIAVAKNWIGGSSKSIPLWTFYFALATMWHEWVDVCYLAKYYSVNHVWWLWW